MDLEQEGCPSVHASTDLKGHDRTVSDNAIDDELEIGKGFDQRAAGKLRQAYVPPLVDGTDRGGRKAVTAQLLGDRPSPPLSRGQAFAGRNPLQYISARAATSARPNMAKRRISALSRH